MQKMVKKFVILNLLKKQKLTLTAKFDNGKYKLFNFVVENCVNDHNKVNGDPKIESKLNFILIQENLWIFSHQY